MAGYTRNDTSNNIATGNVINAADLDGEFDALVAAFHASTGHTHDGTAANGAPITKIGPAQDLVISTGAITPKTDNTVDLGSSSFEFKDLYIDGTANIDALVADTADINAGTIDGVTLGTNSAVTEAQIDNININGNTISSTDTNGNINLVPNGTGDVILTADTIQIGDSNTDVTVTTNGTGDLIFNTNAGTNSGVIRIYDGANGNIALTPNGTGEVDITKVDIDGGAIDGTTIGASTASTGAFTTLSASSTVTLSGGTANGVLYLDGSKVATSGSALTFESNRFSVGSGTPLAVSGYSNITLNGSTGGLLEIKSNDTRVLQIQSDGAAAGAQITTVNNGSNPPLIFGVNSTEAMRLTSTGLGIGTSSPAYKLDVQGEVQISNGSALRWKDSGGTSYNLLYLYSDNNAYLSAPVTGSSLIFRGVGFAERMRLDSSGNLGLGVTPSAWSSTYKAYQISEQSITGTSGQSLQAFNAYYDGASWKYINSNYANYIEVTAGQFRWNTAPSGTAGNAITFTQAMTLDASGNLGVGTTSPQSPLHVYGTNGITLGVSNTTWQTAAIRAIDEGSAYKGTLAFYTHPYAVLPGSPTERARIDSSGNLLVGRTSAGTATAGFQVGSGSGAYINVTNTSSGSADELVYLVRNGLSGSGNYIEFVYGTTAVGSISCTSSATAYNTSSDYRLKDNPQPLTGSGAFIDALKPKTWNWKADGSRGVGFIAHEVQEVSPGSVVGEKDGEQMQAMEYGSAEFIANIIAELQSLRQRVAQLEGTQP